jgi:hypothetical protein
VKNTKRTLFSLCPINLKNWINSLIQFANIGCSPGDLIARKSTHFRNFGKCAGNSKKIIQVGIGDCSYLEIN